MTTTPKHAPEPVTQEAREAMASYYRHPLIANTSMAEAVLADDWEVGCSDCERAMLETFASLCTSPAPSQHSELADREWARQIIYAVARHNQIRGLPVSDALLDEIAALRQPPSDAMREALMTARDYVSDIANGLAVFSPAVQNMAADDLKTIDAALTQGKPDALSPNGGV